MDEFTQQLADKMAESAKTQEELKKKAILQAEQEQRFQARYKVIQNELEQQVVTMTKEAQKLCPEVEIKCAFSGPASPYISSTVSGKPVFWKASLCPQAEMIGNMGMCHLWVNAYMTKQDKSLYFLFIEDKGWIVATATPMPITTAPANCSDLTLKKVATAISCIDVIDISINENVKEAIAELLSSTL